MERESTSRLSDKAVSIIKANLLVSALFFIGLIFLSIGLMQFFNQPKQEIEFVSGETVEGAATSEIYIDVSGEVQKPGVYKLDGNTRTQDALIAAGGLTREADREYISKAMNLASPLKDGMKIYIPARGESAPLTTSAGIATSVHGGLISINSGSQSELESLPGIGPVTAGKIIDNRPYGSVDELLSRKVVGKATFEKIRDLAGL